MQKPLHFSTRQFGISLPVLDGDALFAHDLEVMDLRILEFDAGAVLAFEKDTCDQFAFSDRGGCIGIGAMTRDGKVRFWIEVVMTATTGPLAVVVVVVVVGLFGHRC